MRQLVPVSGASAFARTRMRQLVPVSGRRVSVVLVAFACVPEWVACEGGPFLRPHAYARSPCQVQQAHGACISLTPSTELAKISR